MSGIFGGGDGGAGAQLEMQKQQLAKQESQVNEQRTEMAQRSQAAIRARQRGGQRFLLSGMDEGTGKTTLGG